MASRNPCIKYSGVEIGKQEIPWRLFLFPRLIECIIDRMKTRNRAGLVWLVLGVAAAFLGYQAWQTSREVAVIIAWETASELDTAGFNLYRGPHETGPFVLVNEFLIPGSTDPITGGSYEFVDTDVTGGETYYYQLEEVEQSGTSVLVETTKVQAAAGGQLELGLAGLLFIVAVFGFLGQVRAGKDVPRDEI